MGIFKDLFRDIAESRLSQRELYIKWAQEKALEGDWDKAGYFYKEAGEWEHAGDAYMQCWKRKQGNNGAPNHAAECYREGRHYSRMRDAYLEALRARTFGGAHPKEAVQNLRQAGELENFMKSVFQAFADSHEAELAVGDLFSGLHKAQEASHAAELFLRYRQILKYQRNDAIKGLLKAGRVEKALEICRLLAGEKSLDGGAFQNIIKVFLDAKAHEGVRELCVAYFALQPEDFVLRSVKAWSKEAAHWKVFLEDALKQAPLELGNALCSLGEHEDEAGELEANFLLRCYDAVGPKQFTHAERWIKTTTEWLLYLADFWKGKANSDKERQVRLRYLNDTKGVGKELSLKEIESTADMYIRNGDLAKAAALYQKAAEVWAEVEQKNGYNNIISKIYLLRAGNLFEKAGNREKAAEVYRQANRLAKADRLAGNPRYDTSEGEALWSLFEIDDIMRSAKTKEEPGGWFQRDQSLEKLLASSVERLSDPGVSLLSLFRELHWLSDKTPAAKKIRQVEMFFRDHGLALNGAALWLMEGNLDEFERVCIEEDELEVATLWYDRINVPERAAKIYDLMGQSGKPGKAQSEGAKQKPQDAARPKSDSAEELKREDFDQLVCPQCGTEVKPHWTVCPKCDADLKQRACGNCGEPLEPDWKKCPACRTPI